jgi:hypothetical protein
MVRLSTIALLGAALRVSAQIYDPLSVTQSNNAMLPDATVYVDVTEPCTQTQSAEATITATIVSPIRRIVRRLPSLLTNGLRLQQPAHSAQPPPCHIR